MILDLIALDHSSKVWVYQAKDALTDEQTEGIREDLYAFLQQWTSHNNRLFTYGNVFHYQFIAIFVDERYAGASGCSIDKSVHFIEALEQKYNISLMERTQVAFMEKEIDEDGEDISKIYTIELNDLGKAYHDGVIHDQTFVFDNLVKTKGDFLQRWVLPFGESWQKKFV